MTERDPVAERLIALLSGRPVAVESFDREDWQRIVDLAQKQKVAPMLHARLRERNITPASAATQQLRELFLANIKHNTRLLHELRNILCALHAAEIPVIPLKGACLAESVYGDVALRQIGDLDLLVKPADVTKALEVLTTLEYVADEPFEIESESQLSQHMPPLSKPGGGRLDLHWTIVNPWLGIRFDDSDLEQVWSRATPVKLVGVNVLMLSPADLLLYLCLHASVQHRFDGIGLRSFWDMALVIRHYGNVMDWEQFTRHANQWEIVNGVRLVLQLLEEWTDTNLPKCVMESLIPATLTSEMISRVRHRILSGRPIASKGDVTRSESKARIVDILAALRDALFPSRLVMANEYHVPADSWIILCYYPVRFKDLWKRYPEAIWQVLGRDQKLIEMQQELDIRQYLD